MKVNCPHCLGIVDVIIESTESPTRSDPQRNALELYCKNLGSALNDGGLGMTVVLAHHAHVPWNQRSVKDYIWRPVQEAMTGHKSTTKPSTKDYPAIYDTLNAHFSEKHGLYVPWPCRETQMEEALA